MNILAISGSSRTESSNMKLLEYLQKANKHLDWNLYNQIEDLPLFRPSYIKDQKLFESVTYLKKCIIKADAVIISSPEYTHNIPACLKNALEWITASGELHQKKTIAIAYTPHSPRGEKALQSLLWTLQALDANILSQLLIHHTDIKFDQNGTIIHNHIEEILSETVELLRV